MEQLILSNSLLPTIRESLIKGIEISSGAKSSATYYHSKAEQVLAVKEAVKKLYNVSKELPLLLAYQNGATGFFIQEALLNELKNTANGGALNIINPIEWHDNHFSDLLIKGAIENLDQNNGITYLFRLYQQIKSEKINNKRTRRLFLSYLYNHPNIDFIAIKYRNKLKEILLHLYGTKTVSAILKESDLFVNNSLYQNHDLIKNCIDKYTTDSDKSLQAINLIRHAFKKNVTGWKLYDQYNLSKSDIFSSNLIPEEVLLGLISNKNHPQYEDLWSTKDKRENTIKKIRESNKSTTANQVLRQTKKNESLKIEKKVDLEQVTDFIALYKTGYENGFNQELNDAIEKLADKKRINDFYYSNIGIVVDNSDSMSGHSIESKNTPRAIANFTSKVLEKSAQESFTVKTTSGQTDLASSFVDLIRSNRDFDAIFFLTDGYENGYDGLTGEIINKWKSMSGSNAAIYQLSPITGAEVGAKVRNISDQVSTIAIAKPESVQLQMTAKLLEQDTRKWLELQVEQIKLNAKS